MQLASGIAASGSRDEAHQSLTFVLTIMSGDASIFSQPPSIDATSGVLSYVPNANAFGKTEWKIVLFDDGGTEKLAHTRGQNASEPRLITLDILPVNDPPSFSLLSEFIAASEGTSVPHPPTNFTAQVATGILAGPPDEAWQALSFSVTGFEGNQAFTAPPQISASGVLAMQITSAVSFRTVLNVSLHDDGQSERGGVPYSPTQEITVDFIAPPVSVTGLAVEQQNTSLVVSWTHADFSAAASLLGIVRHYR